MAISSPTSRVKVDDSQDSGPSMFSPAEFGAEQPAPAEEAPQWGQPEQPASSSLPPRRTGAPPKLLGDHPARIAMTSVPEQATLPATDPVERRAEVKKARRFENAKMVMLSLVVFGLIGGMIQWTRSTKADEQARSRQARTEQLKREEDKRALASNDDMARGARHEQ